ncbi:glycosyltransferase [Bacillus marinisedimentorum]|uniref:glycosyltransferase n=1 Tax=Bacillus marinisedimentorum TaxID=1821260 RepID=UPI0007E13C70|nr:glycosyltransferase [Bacillus marinisedimentorum]
MNRILYIGIHHRKNDPRLFYREIRLIKNKFPKSDIYIITRRSVNNSSKPVIHFSEELTVDNNIVNHIEIQYDNLQNMGILAKLKHKMKTGMYYLRICKELNADVIQASDARELLSSLIIAKVSGAKTIYDSHEDYVRQILDYQKKSVKTYLLALKLFLYEFLFIRFYDIVFCTDEFLLDKYKKMQYSAKSVNILRNFPYIEDKHKKKFQDKDTLKLVYIGGVNEHRGVIECANYVEKFNENHIEKKLIFDVFSPPNEITEELVKKGFINHTSWIDYKDLMELLKSYDVGVCLWHPIKKFYRNLPLKNFDYMGSGLPIITSNFGNLKRHMDKSDAGICIDPLNYSDFENAIIKLFDPQNREKYSENGIYYSKSEASFQNEGKRYAEFIEKRLEN